MTSNSAAWIEAKAHPFKVYEAPMPKPGPDEVVVKNGAVAINPVDWKVQDSGFIVQKWPFILGTDVAGEVVDVGSDVKAFKKGDRVLAHCIGLATGHPEDNGFQLYSRVPAILTAPIPSSLSFTHATVLPLAISTAAAGLYQSTELALPYPSINPKDSGKAILVWGGSSSVGSTAIQLAVASGVTVITTASARNHGYCKKIGAAAVLDYNSSSVVDDIVSALKSTGREFVGVFDSISLPESFKHCFAVIEQAGGSKKKMVTVLPPPEEKPAGVQVSNVFAPSIGLQNKEVGKAVWEDFVPLALGSGALKCLPEPLVVGNGLENVQKAVDRQKEGVSAKKVVVEL